jgi:hypothetical protein
MLERRQFCGWLCVASVSCILPDVAEAAPALRSLFTIGRSKNKNVVRYSARCHKQVLDVTAPIEAHWLMLAEDGRREELTWAERQLAYGFGASKVSVEGCQLHLVAFKARSISVERRGAAFRAVVDIAGRRAELERIFVQTNEGILPSVVHVDLHGRSLDGAPLSGRRCAR